ncbi:MAG: tetratricopeptide repeat protein, partial [Methylophagaceae bacterium]
IQKDKDNYELYFAKAKLQLDLGHDDEVITGLKQIASLDRDGNYGRRATMMLAAYDLKQGDIEAAQLKAKEVLAVAPEDEAALLLMSRIEISNKNVDAAVTNLRLILRNNPESDQALVLLAQAYMNSGSTELADDNFRQALAVNPGNSVAALFVANNLMKAKDLDRTEEVLTAALAKATNKEALLQALAQVKILKKDWDGTQAVVDSLRSNKEDTALTLYLNGRISQGQEHYETAIQEYKAALDKSPNLMRALQGLAFSHLKLEQKPQLLEYLNAFIKKNPDQIPSYGVLANLYIQSQDWDKAISTLNKGLESEPKWQGGYSTLASVYLAQNKQDKAIETYQLGIDNTENNTLLMLKMASASEQHGDFDKAKSIYETILEKNPNVEPAINNLASLLTDQFRSEENLQKAQALAARFSSATQPFYLDTYAWTNVLLGNYEKAQNVLERVVSLSPDIAVFNYHLGALYLKQGNKLDAEKYLNIAKSLAEKQNDLATSKKVDELLTSL